MYNLGEEWIVKIYTKGLCYLLICARCSKIHDLLMQMLNNVNIDHRE